MVTAQDSGLGAVDERKEKKKPSMLLRVHHIV